MTSQGPIQSACQTARESLVELLGGSGPVVEPAQGFHCDACQAWFQRARSQAKALGLLPRLVAELGALDGLVVAELNAGCRQERAATALKWLEHLQAPSELDARMDEWVGRPVGNAPMELDLRVAHELTAGAGLRTERQVSALARLAAPGELEVRVVRDLSRTESADGAPARRWIALAAALLVVVGAASLARHFAGDERQPYEFQVVHTSLASLDAFARGQIPGAAVVPEGGSR